WEPAKVLSSYPAPNGTPRKKKKIPADMPLFLSQRLWHHSVSGQDNLIVSTMYLFRCHKPRLYGSMLYLCRQLARCPAQHKFRCQLKTGAVLTFLPMEISPSYYSNNH